MSLVADPLQLPCTKLLKDASCPMIHTFLDYDTNCIFLVRILHLRPHRRDALHHSKTPGDAQFLNRSHDNVNQGISKLFL
jgi:hypothetical protein